MYCINEFCNILTSLRKEKGWSQAELAEKLDISQQSVSKWETGVGYPDVTMFPVLAEIFAVPIGVLFGEDYTRTGLRKEYRFNGLGECRDYKLYLGNECRVEFIEEDEHECVISVSGDDTFLRFFDVEQEGHTIILHINNPSGTAEYWKEYDRNGYPSDNYIKIYTGGAKDTANIQAINYLNLTAESSENPDGNYEICCFSS